MLRTLFIGIFVSLISIINGCQYIGSDAVYRAGIRRAPGGYEYVKDQMGQLICDDDGNPLFRKIGRRYVYVWMGTGFAPTPEEYKRYKQLMEGKYQLEKEGDFAKAQQIAEEIAQLKETAEREIPLVGTDFNHIIYNYGYLKDTTEAENACNALRETFRETYKAHGLEHLLVCSGDDFQFNTDNREKKKVLPPPPGYWYLFNEDFTALQRDREGNPVLEKLEEPSISISIKIGVPPEEQNRIDLLTDKKVQMIVEGNDLAAKQIASHIAYLEYKARSEVLFITGGSSGGIDIEGHFMPILEKTRALVHEVSSRPKKRATRTEK